MTTLWRCHWCGETHQPQDLVPTELRGELLCPKSVAGQPQVGWLPEWQTELDAQVACALAGGAYLNATDLSTVLGALDVAADCKRERADYCGDCTGQPDSPLCPDCENRLQDADTYDALAERLRGDTP